MALQSSIHSPPPNSQFPFPFHPQISNHSLQFTLSQSPNPKFNQIQTNPKTKTKNPNSLFSLPSQTKPTNTTSHSPPTMSWSSSSSSPSKSPFVPSEHSDLAMALSSLSLDKENSAPPSSSSTSTTTTSTSSRKRKGCFRDCWFRVPLEDITHLYHPNIIVGDVKEVAAMPSNASSSHVDAPVERRIVAVRRWGLKLKPVEMKTRVSLRKEFR